jgi:hypothetical protein
MNSAVRPSLTFALALAAGLAVAQSNGQGSNQNSHDRNHQSSDQRTDSRSRHGHDQTASYGSNSNHYRPTERQHIDRAPQVHPNSNEFRHVSDSHDFSHLYGADARRGYYGYSSRWTDSNFFFGSYVFDPFVSVGCVSPWYYYSFLPGYIAPSAVVFTVGNLQLAAYSGVEYPWFAQRRHHRFDGGFSSGYQDGYAAGAAASAQIANNDVLDSGLGDIVDVFEQRDLGALNRVVPQSGDVDIYVDGVFQYGVSADSFYDLLKDNATSARTVRYDIVDVRFNTSNLARVVAAHDYIDPWGVEQTVYQTYLLSVTHRGVQILEFGTSQTRPR